MINLWREVRGVVLLLARIVGRLGASLLVFVLLLVALKLLYQGYTYHFGFDRAQWAASAAVLRTDALETFDNPRQSMIADVLSHELRLGMPRVAVLTLLGPADYDKAGDWQYEVGWGAVDPIALMIEFSEEGTVQKYYIRD